MAQNQRKIKIFSAILGMIIFIISFFAFSGFLNLEFDYDFEKFFPKNDSETQFFKKHRKTFGSDNDFIIVGIKNEKGIFKESFLHKIDSLSSLLVKSPYITNVQSPTNIKQPVIDPLMGTIFQKPILRLNDPKFYFKDSINIFNDELLVQNFFSTKIPAIALILTTEEYLSKAKCDSVAIFVNKTIGKFKFDEYHIAGRSTGQINYIRLIQKELIKFIVASVFLVIIFLILAFRSIWGVVVPFVIVMLSIIWLIGFLGFFNQPLGVLSTILPTILFIVGMSDVVHFINKYIEGIRLGYSKYFATTIAFKEIGLATFLTTLTTAVGFITLLTAKTQPIKDFGIQASIGVMVAYLLTFSILPTFLWIKKKGFSKKLEKKKSGIFWDKFLRSSFLLCTKNPKKILLLFFFIIGLSLWGISLISQNNYLLDDIKNDNPIKVEFKFFDNNFAGVRPFELSINFDSSDSITIKKIKVLNEIEDYLKDKYELGNILSLATLVKSLNKSFNGGKNKYFKIPKKIENQKKIMKYLSKLVKSQKTKPFISSDLKNYRVVGKLPDLGSEILRKRNRDFLNFVKNHYPQTNVQITGTAHLLDRNNKYLSKSLLNGLGLAFIIIALLMGLLFRSFKMIILALIPNIIPLVIIAASWVLLELN